MFRTILKKLVDSVSMLAEKIVIFTKKRARRKYNCFVNFSNHPSVNWGEIELLAAKQWGEIKDIPFPKVPAYADSEEVCCLAEKCVAEILSLKPRAVLCQGEFTLTFLVASRLKKEGIYVVAACSERRTTEEKQPDGVSRKVSEFEFVQFREY